MGKFRDLSIHLSFEEQLPDGLAMRDFNITTHNVQDIFRYLLPHNYDFGGIGKLNILISGKQGENEYVHHDIALYRHKKFDFSAYFGLSQYDRNNVIWQLLKSTVLDIAARQSLDAHYVIEIIDRIKALEFSYSFRSRLSKKQRGGKFDGIILVTIDAQGTNAYFVLRDKAGQELTKVHLIKERVYEFRNNLHKTKWEGDVFQIFDRHGQVFKSFDINGLEVDR